MEKTDSVYPITRTNSLIPLLPHPTPKSLRSLYSWIYQIRDFFVIELHPYVLDRLTDQRIVSTSEDECSGIRSKLREVFSEQYIDLGSCYDTLFDQWNEPWSCNLLNYDRIIEDMYSFFVHTGTHRGLRSEDSYFFISTYRNCLSSWHRHTEDLTSDEYLRLHPSQGMHTCSIASKYNNISSSCIEPLDSFFCQISYLIATPVSIWSIVPIHLEDHLDIWIFTTKRLHHYLSPES